MTRIITEEEFVAATRRPVRVDDLERANCPKAGQPGHLHCGWDDEKNLPRSMSTPLILQQKGTA